MAVIGQIGFAASKTLVERLRKSTCSHAVFILQDELLGPLVVHGSARRLRVTTLEEFEREHRMVGVVQPKVQLGPALAQVLDELRSGRAPAPCTELVCEVLRRGGYPGAFSLRSGDQRRRAVRLPLAGAAGVARGGAPVQLLGRRHHARQDHPASARPLSARRRAVSRSGTRRGGCGVGRGVAPAE